MNPIITLPVRDHINGYLRAELDRTGFPWLPVYGSSDLPRVRSVLLTRAMRGEYDRVICIDADIVARAEDIQRLATHPRLDADSAVTGLYAVRSGECWACKCTSDPPEADGCRKAEWAGLGFACIMTDSLLRAADCEDPIREPDIEPWWPLCVPFIDIRKNEPFYCADDVSLWARLAEVKVQLWADPSLVVGHQALTTLMSPVDKAKAQVLPHLELLGAKVDNARQGGG